MVARPALCHIEKEWNDPLTTTRAQGGNVMVALLVLFTVLVFLTVDYFLQRRTAAAPVPSPLPTKSRRHELAPDYRTPAGVFFHPAHTWMFLEESGTVKLGINDLAASVIGKIDGITTRKAGDHVRQGEVLFTLSHGDRTATFRAPVDCVISGFNPEQVTNPTLSGKPAFTDAWLCRITPDDSTDFSRAAHLGARARQWLNREVQRLKVFVATTVPEHPVLAQTMQDGGLPAPGLIDELSDDEWKKLHEGFFGGLVKDNTKAESE